MEDLDVSVTVQFNDHGENEFIRHTTYSINDSSNNNIGIIFTVEYDYAASSKSGMHRDWLIKPTSPLWPSRSHLLDMSRATPTLPYPTTKGLSTEPGSCLVVTNIVVTSDLKDQGIEVESLIELMKIAKASFSFCIFQNWARLKFPQDRKTLPEVGFTQLDGFNQILYLH